MNTVIKHIVPVLLAGSSALSATGLEMQLQQTSCAPYVQIDNTIDTQIRNDILSSKYDSISPICTNLQKYLQDADTKIDNFQKFSALAKAQISLKRLNIHGVNTKVVEEAIKQSRTQANRVLQSHGHIPYGDKETIAIDITKSAALGTYEVLKLHYNGKVYQTSSTQLNQYALLQEYSTLAHLKGIVPNPKKMPLESSTAYAKYYSQDTSVADCTSKNTLATSVSLVSEVEQKNIYRVATTNLNCRKDPLTNEDNILKVLNEGEVYEAALGHKDKVTTSGNFILLIHDSGEKCWSSMKYLESKKNDIELSNSSETKPSPFEGVHHG